MSPPFPSSSSSSLRALNAFLHTSAIELCRFADGGRPWHPACWLAFTQPTVPSQSYDIIRSNGISRQTAKISSFADFVLNTTLHSTGFNLENLLYLASKIITGVLLRTESFNFLPHLLSRLWWSSFARFITSKNYVDFQKTACLPLCVQCEAKKKKKKKKYSVLAYC